MPDPVEAYFTELRDIHRSGAGVKEWSYDSFPSHGHGLDQQPFA